MQYELSDKHPEKVSDQIDYQHKETLSQSFCISAFVFILYEKI